MSCDSELLQLRWHFIESLLSNEQRHKYVWWGHHMNYFTRILAFPHNILYNQICRLLDQLRSLMSFFFSNDADLHLLLLET